MLDMSTDKAITLTDKLVELSFTGLAYDSAKGETPLQPSEKQTPMPFQDPSVSSQF